VFFLRFGNHSAHSLTASGHSGLALPGKMLDGGSAAPPSQQDGDDWQAIYRQAYEHLVQRSGPSAFGRAIRPSDN
jgi:hypothetical protein